MVQHHPPLLPMKINSEKPVKSHNCNLIVGLKIRDTKYIFPSISPYLFFPSLSGLQKTLPFFFFFLFWKHIVLSFQKIHWIVHITNRIHLISIFLVSQCFQSALIHVHAPGLNTELGTSDSQHLQAPFKVQTQIQTLNYSEQSLTTCHAKPRANKPKINIYPTYFLYLPQCLFI